MNVVKPTRMLLVAALVATLGACATVPPGPPPDVVRLQNDLDRLHSDPRIASNAGAELGNADAAVDVLSRNARTLGPREYQQGVYIADKLIRIAEASALARDAEQRGTALGIERERLLATTVPATRRDVIVTTTEAPPPIVRNDGELMPRARAELVAMQERLPGIESSLDARGLIVRFGDFMFEPGTANLVPRAEQSLDSVARVLRTDNDASITIEGYGNTSLALQRANAVRDYLDARNVDVSRIHARSVQMIAARDDVRGGANAPRVDIVIRSDLQ